MYTNLSHFVLVWTREHTRRQLHSMYIDTLMYRTHLYINRQTDTHTSLYAMESEMTLLTG